MRRREEQVGWVNGPQNLMVAAQDNLRRGPVARLSSARVATRQQLENSKKQRTRDCCKGQCKLYEPLVNSDCRAIRPTKKACEKNHRPARIFDSWHQVNKANLLAMFFLICHGASFSLQVIQRRTSTTHKRGMEFGYAMNGRRN